ncbi:MAG TPA: hypothetical protein VF265_08025 [Nevskiaceae bacterium]
MTFSLRRLADGFRARHGEHARIVRFLKSYRASESLNAHYVGGWARVTRDEALRGGLIIVQAREGIHARLMRERLREFNVTRLPDVSEHSRRQAMALFATDRYSDRQKLDALASLIEHYDAIFAPVNRLIGDIRADAQTAQMLRLMLDDEYATTQWFARMRDRPVRAQHC